MVALLALAAAAASEPRDERMAVVVLPVAAESGPSAMAERAGRSMTARVASTPGFVVVVLDPGSRDRLAADPRCASEPGCLHGLLPAGVDLAIETRIEVRSGYTVLDARLHRNGAMVWRRTGSVDPTAIERAASAAADAMLAGWSRAARLYALAWSGNAEAVRQLEQRFPASPYTRAMRRQVAGSRWPGAPISP